MTNDGWRFYVDRGGTFTDVVAQAPDGMTVRDAVTFHAIDAARIPSEAELTRGVTALAENVVALAHAPKGEDYSGPQCTPATSNQTIVLDLKFLHKVPEPSVEAHSGKESSGNAAPGRLNRNSN